MTVRARSDRPKVTIGLAVFNGADHLQATIDGLLAQSFADFELILCDNASTDATPRICTDAAVRDPRVRYYRNPENIGGVRNENMTFHLARGDYFKLSAHDDLVSADFLRIAVERLERHPSVDLSVPEVRVIDGEGHELDTCAPIAGLELRPHQRLRAIAHRSYMCEGIYGVARMSALRSVRLQANHLHSDRTVLTELALRRPFALAEGAILFRRLHGGNTFRDWRGRMAWFQPELKESGAIRLPHWLQLADFAAVVVRGRVGVVEAIRCQLEVARWALHSWRSLAMDVWSASRLLVWGRARRTRWYAKEGR